MLLTTLLTSFSFFFCISSQSKDGLSKLSPSSSSLIVSYDSVFEDANESSWVRTFRKNTRRRLSRDLNEFAEPSSDLIKKVLNHGNKKEGSAVHQKPDGKLKQIHNLESLKIKNNNVSNLLKKIPLTHHADHVSLGTCSAEDESEDYADDFIAYDSDISITPTHTMNQHSNQKHGVITPPHALSTTPHSYNNHRNTKYFGPSAKSLFFETYNELDNQRKKLLHGETAILKSLSNVPVHNNRKSSRRNSFKDLRFSISQALSYSKEVEEMNKSNENLLNMGHVSILIYLYILYT